MGWQWHQLDNMQIISISLQTDNHASTSSLNFLQADCSSWRPTNSVDALKANQSINTQTHKALSCGSMSRDDNLQSLKKGDKAPK